MSAPAANPAAREQPIRRGQLVQVARPALRGRAVPVLLRHLLANGFERNRQRHRPASISRHRGECLSLEFLWIVLILVKLCLNQGCHFTWKNLEFLTI